MTKTVYEPGIHSITNEQYHQSEGISRSVLWTFKELPQKYWYQYLSGDYERPKESEAYLIGNLVHTALLEPHLMGEQYYEMPKVNRTTKQGKLDYEAAMAESGGRTLVNEPQMRQGLDMVSSLISEQLVTDVISGAQFEKSIYWRDQETGIMCKCRPDIWNDPLCGDLKTTDDASPRGFQLSAVKYGYFLQAAMLYEGLKSIGMPFEKFLFICVEKKKPYPVGMYLLDDEALQYGLDLFHSLLRRFAVCQINNEWSGYGVQSLTAPKYATLELLNE
jgi:hypothetical protein